MSGTNSRLWISAIASWLSMLGLIAVVVGSGLWPRRITDPDIRSYGELAATFMFFLAIPLLVIAVGVFRPFMGAAVRREMWRAGRLWNSIMGLFLVVPALMAFAVVGTIAGWRMRGGPLPVDLLVLLAFGGFVFGATMPANVAYPRAPANK